MCFNDQLFEKGQKFKRQRLFQIPPGCKVLQFPPTENFETKARVVLLLIYSVVCMTVDLYCTFLVSLSSEPQVPLDRYVGGRRLSVR